MEHRARTQGDVEGGDEKVRTTSKVRQRGQEESNEVAVSQREFGGQAGANRAA